MPPASLVASLLLSLSNFNLSCSSCIRYFNGLYCSDMESACSSSDLVETWISLRPAVSLSQDCTLWRYHIWPQTVSFGITYSGVCNFSGLFYLLYFLSSLFVSILQSFISLLLQVTIPFLFEFSSFSSCVYLFSFCRILTSAVSYVRNKLFQVLELFCMVINYRRRMWSSANCRGKIGQN